MKPDPDQQEIIHLDRGRHLVLAPPGCGKTFILAQRVIHAHAHGVEYADMLCLTFTNRASRAMRERIVLHTHNPVPSDLFVGNVHRFCSNYLFDQKKIPQNSAVIDDLDSESIITYLARLDPRDNNSRYAADIVNLSHALSQHAAGMPRKLIVHADLLDKLDDPRWTTCLTSRTCWRKPTFLLSTTPTGTATVGFKSMRCRTSTSCSCPSSTSSPPMKPPWFTSATNSRPSSRL